MSRSPGVSQVALLGFATMMLGCGVEAQQLAGAYTVGTPVGFLTLSLEVGSEGMVNGVLVEHGNEYVLTGTYDDGEVIGRLVSAQLRGDFEIYFEEDDGHHYFVFVPLDPSGNAMAAAEVEWPMVRGDDAEAIAKLEAIVAISPAPSDSAPDAGDETTAAPRSADGSESRDPRLIGLWRSQVTMSDPGGGFVQDFFMEFSNDRVMRSWMGRAAASVGGGSVEVGEGGVEEVRWRTVGDRLQVGAPNGAWAPLASVYIEGPSLLLTYYDGDRQLWTKVR